MKRKKRTSLKSSSSQQFVEEETYLYLPDEVWESIFQFIFNDEGRRCLNSLSLISKQFLSVTNSLLFSLRVHNSTLPFLKRLLKRFTKLTSRRLYYSIEVDNNLRLISSFPLKKLTLLFIDNRTVPTNGLRAFSQNITTLTSLTCYSMLLTNTDLLLVANCFPLLKELNLKRPLVIDETNYINGIRNLLSKCRCIQLLNLDCTYFLKDQHVVELSFYMGNLVSISLNNCHLLTETTLFSLVRNCPSLSEIQMQSSAIGEESVGHSDSLVEFGVYPQLKSLYLGYTLWLSDEIIIMFASIFPNLKLLDLKGCHQIFDGICHVLRKCRELKHLNLAYCEKVKILAMNFEVPKLEVLNLSNTRVSDKTLYAIAKSCCGLLQLLLEDCDYVTNKGVKRVVLNCTQLREIYLGDFHVSDKNKKLVLDRGCLLC